MFSSASPAFTCGLAAFTRPAFAAGTERLMAWPRLLRSLEVAASGAVVLGSAFCSQAAALLHRLLLTSANRELHILLRQSWLLAVVEPRLGHQCIESAGTL